MKVEKLIKALKDIPKGTEVCIVDFEENEKGVDDCESSEGIYPEFYVSVMKGDSIADDSKSFVALFFTREDYSDFNRPFEGIKKPTDKP